MKVIRTERAIEGIRSVAGYIARTFGRQALLEFQARLQECTKLIKENPGIGSVDWDVSTQEKQYLTILIYRRSWMVYRVEGEIIYIVDFYDTRKSNPSNERYE